LQVIPIQAWFDIEEDHGIHVLILLPLKYILVWLEEKFDLEYEKKKSDYYFMLGFLVLVVNIVIFEYVKILCAIFKLTTVYSFLFNTLFCINIWAYLLRMTYLYESKGNKSKLHNYVFVNPKSRTFKRDRVKEKEVSI